MFQSHPAPGRTFHPALFFILYLPFGATAGFLVVSLEFFYARAGVTTAAFGALVSIALLPQVLKVFWAPLVDTTLNVKAWYILAMAVLAPAMAASGFLPVKAASLPLLTLLSLASSVAASIAGMASESLMAHATLPHRRGAAGGWSQAGNLGGAGIGGGIGLEVANLTHSLPLASSTVGALAAACALALLFAPVSTHMARGANYLATLLDVAKQCWAACWSRPGLLVLLVFVVPLGSGGAGQLFSAIAKDWHAGPEVVSGTAGIAGVFTAMAAVAGGYVCDRMDRKAAYVLFGLICAATALAMALSPRTPEWFIALVFAYSGALGLSYAGFSALTLEIIGGGAAATKYNLFASVSNIPVVIMPAVDGWAATRWNSGVMLLVEAGAGVLGALIYVAVVFATRRRLAAVATA